MKKDNDLKKFGDLVKEVIRPVKEVVEVLKNKVDHQEFYLTTTASNVRSVKEQQSVINEKLDSLKTAIYDPKTGLKRINERMEVLWDQVVKVTADLGKTQETINSHTSYLKRI